MFKKGHIHLGLAFFFALTIVKADEAIYALSLEELMKIEVQVETATKKKEPIFKAPAIITVLKSEDFKARGVSNLYEAIATLPGVSMAESYFGYSMLNFRGGLQTHYNNSVLFLINGHASYEPMNGSFHLEHIPLNIIDRIEVIRGPGSALYGTNAMEGVINIITKRPLESTGEIHTTIGSNDHREGGVWWGDQNWRFSISSHKNGGYDYSGTLDEDTFGNGRNPVDFDNEDEVSNFFLDYENEGLRVNAAYFQQKKFMFGITPEVTRSGRHEYDGAYFDLKYDVGLAGGDFTSRLRYDYMERKTYVGGSPQDPPFSEDIVIESEGSIFGLELEYAKTFMEIDFITGFVYQYLYSGPFEHIKLSDRSLNASNVWSNSYDANDYSFYLQAVYNPTEKIQFVTGGRLNKYGDDGEITFVPRLGISYFHTDALTFKILYSEAYRNPDFFEQFLGNENPDNAPGPLHGNPNLEPELIRTVDFGIDYFISQNHHLRLNLFLQERKDSIQRRPAEIYGTSFEYYNASGDRSYGVEFELDGKFNSQWMYYSNFSWMDGEEKQSNNEINGLVNVTVNSGLTYLITESLSASLNVQYSGEAENTLSSGETYTVDDFLIPNLVLQYKLDNLTIRGVVKNLTDEEYSYPEYIRANIEDTPGGAGRSFYLTLEYSF